MRPDAILAALARATAAGRRLRQRPVEETLDAVARALDSFADATSPWRRELEEKLPAATGFSPEGVHEGLALGLADWNGAALRELVHRELGGLGPKAELRVGGFESCGVFLAGALPTPTLLSLLAPLVMRTPVVAKSASHDPVTASLVARCVADADAGLGECIELVSFPGADADCAGALAQAACVVANGSDETIARVAARVAPPRRFVGYGHRLSVAVLGGEATRGQALEEAAAGLARDIALWDQLGCLSPVAIYVETPDIAAADRVADSLAAELQRAEQRWPRGHVPVESAAAIRRERDEAHMRATTESRITIRSGAEAAFTVILEDASQPRTAPLHRFVRVHPVAGEAGLSEALRPLRHHLAGAALAGFGRRTEALVQRLAAWGASRVCAPGRLQAPPLDWRRDGRGVLLPLARFTSVDRPGPA